MHWLRLAIVAAILLASPDALAVQPDEILKDQRRRRARANRQSSCVAWCAKTSRSTIRMRRLRATCASWCASACRPATRTSRHSISWCSATANSCCCGRVRMANRAALAGAARAADRWWRGALHSGPTPRTRRDTVRCGPSGRNMTPHFRGLVHNTGRRFSNAVWL